MALAIPARGAPAFLTARLLLGLVGFQKIDEPVAGRAIQRRAALARTRPRAFPIDTGEAADTIFVAAACLIVTALA